MDMSVKLNLSYRHPAPPNRLAKNRLLALRRLRAAAVTRWYPMPSVLPSTAMMPKK